MRVTFDHNCLISLEQGGPVADEIRRILSSPNAQCFVVKVGASEMLRVGVRRDNYKTFEEFLSRLGLGALPCLDPIVVSDITFFDNCVFPSDDEIRLYQQITGILFPSPRRPVQGALERKTVNQICDVLTMLCHISAKNDVFLTTDGNFFKATKLPRLLELDAGQVCRPGDFIAMVGQPPA